jgi:hypothetical protein
MDNAPGVRFVSLTFLVGFGIGAFIGVALALIAVVIALPPQDQEPKVVEVPVIATATSTPLPDDTPIPPIRATGAAAVRIGPGEEYATLGTITDGDVLDVVGRDFDSEWLAIHFPAGSTAQGWIPASVAEGMTFSSLEALAVLLPTPLPIQVVTPVFVGTPGTPGTGTPGIDEGTPHPAAGTLDLAVFDVSALPDGRVRVVVLNGGPEDLTEGLLVVEIRTLSLDVERVNYAGDLPAGGTLALTTSSLTVGDEAETIQVIIDPSSNLKDPNRSNNVESASLSRPEEATPTPEDGSSG